MINRHVWYFAYGSNLNISQMKERIGDWTAAKRAQGEGWQLVFNVRSTPWNGYTANIKKTDNVSDKVYGVVYRITLSQLDKLTEYEGRSPSEITVKMEDGRDVPGSKAYVWPKNDPSKRPPDKYRDTILEGLKQHGYSEEIVLEVKSWIESLV